MKSICRARSLLALFFWFPLLAQAIDLAPLSSKKFIMSGWDEPDTAQFREHIAQFEKYPFDGVILTVPGRKPDGKTFSTIDQFFSPEPWTEEMFTNALADLQATHSATVTNNFVILWSLPATVDWFDDAGWAVIGEKFRVMARVAKQGRLRGILFDPEHYSETHKAWRYLSQPGRGEHSYDQYYAKVRQRGQETMRAMASEYPDITIFGYWLLSMNLRSLDAGGSLAGMVAEDYGLLVPFVDGWLDVAPATVTLVDGQETAYRWDGELPFQRGALGVKNDCQGFISLGNRAKYRAQVQASFGFYLDAYVNAPGSSYYLGREGEPRADRLEANLEAAARAADEYVWIYGEKYRWWPAKHSFTNWAQALPGIEMAMLRAKNPTEAARRLLAASNTNLLHNAAFTEATNGKPALWWTWQNEKEAQGRFGLDSALGAVRLSQIFDGCYGQNIKVQPGERYAITAKVRQTGAGLVSLRVGWKNAAGKWSRNDASLRLALSGGTPGEWRELTGAVRVPEEMAQLIVTLYAFGQTQPGDEAWFKDVRLARFEPSR